MNFSSLTRNSPMRPRNTVKTRQFKIAQFFIIGIFILAALVTLTGFVVSTVVVNDYANCTVTRTETTVVSSGDSVTSQKRVYTENCGVFVVNDNFVHGVWNSADIYGSIQEGNTYDFTATGYRVPLFSWFPGIINASPVAR